MLTLGPEWLTIILFGSLVLLLLLGLPLVFAIGGVATLFIILLWGPHALPILANRTYMAMDMFLLVAVPMFIFMGAMLQRCGIAEDMYELMYHWMGGLRGGLAAGTVLICTMFAAMVGISGAATTSMGLIALPSMLKRGYKKDIAIGCISAGGSLGILIPPSVLMIILALTSRLSVGQMFIAGILPGLLLSSLFVAYILIRCYIQKDLGPSVPPEERLPRRERVKLLGALLLPIGLIFAVMGSMFFGLATPSEASAIGALGAIVSAVVKRTFTWESFTSALFITLRLSAMVIWIVFAASAVHRALCRDRRRIYRRQHDQGSRRSLDGDYHHAAHPLRARDVLRSDGHRAAHRPDLFPIGGLARLRSDVVRNTVRDQHGDWPT